MRYNNTLKFTDSWSKIVFEGSHSFREVLNLLYKVGYIESETPDITVQVLSYPQTNYSEKIQFDDSVLDGTISDFEKALKKHIGNITLVID